MVYPEVTVWVLMMAGQKKGYAKLVCSTQNKIKIIIGSASHAHKEDFKMEKKIVFVVREGLAVRNMNGQFNSYRGTASVMTLLEGLKDTLNQIPTNAQGLAQDFVTIYVPDVMNGLLSNSIGLYLRNGQTASGKLIDQAELDLYVEVFNMLNERSFNARLYNLKYIHKDDVATKNIIKNTWSALDREERKLKREINMNAAVNNTVNNAQMETMQQQMQMMQQMMSMFMQAGMMQGNMQMPNMQGMTMPTMPGMPAMQPQPAQPGTEPVPTYGEPTALNVDMSAGSTPQAATQEVTGTEDKVEAYEPEF